MRGPPTRSFNSPILQLKILKHRDLETLPTIYQCHSNLSGLKEPKRRFPLRSYEHSLWNTQSAHFFSLVLTMYQILSKAQHIPTSALFSYTDLQVSPQSNNGKKPKSSSTVEEIMQGKPEWCKASLLLGKFTSRVQAGEMAHLHRGVTGPHHTCAAGVHLCQVIESQDMASLRS